MASPSFQRGSLLGRYEIMEQIGAGGMGVVYRARDTKLLRVVAIKVLASGAEVTEADRRHFQNEALSLSKLNHPNIATLHDFDTVNDVDFLVAELIEGSTLEAQTEKRFSEKEVINLAQQIADGLAAAHAKGVIHRDLKPGNIAVTNDGRVKILDFGLARLLPAVADPASTMSSLTYNMAGTLAYMAPEQLKGSPADERSDIYALGVILFELLTGQSPYRVNTSAELAGAILHQPLASPRTLNPRISVALEQLVMKSLEKDPELRYQTAKDVLVDLRRLNVSTVASNISPIPMAQTRSRKTWLAFGIAGLIVAAAAYWFLIRPVYRAHGPMQSLAVLPLTNLSSDSTQAYLADALTGELTDRLTSISALTVTSNATANRYRNSKEAIVVIAKELNVDAILSGTVMSSGGTVQVGLELIDGRTDRRVWSKRYERKVSEVVNLQSEVTQDIAQQVNLAMSSEEKQRLVRLPTANAKAYEAYLRGDYYVKNALGSREDAEAAIRYAEEAIQLDPDFAEAYVLLAQSCMATIFMGRGGKELDEKAFVATSKALSLNPNLADAYRVRGSLSYNRLHGFDIARSIADYQKALSISPNSAWAHYALGADLIHLGLSERALDELDSAFRLEPQVGGDPRFRKARALWYLNRFPEALKQYEEIDTKTFERAVVLAYLGRKQDAREFLERTSGKQPSPENYDALAGFAFLSALDGNRAETDKFARSAMASGKLTDHFHHAAFTIACAYAELGAASEAVNWLRYTADNGMPNYPLMWNNPSMQKLHGKPAYDKFMEELKPRFEAIASSVQAPK